MAEKHGNRTHQPTLTRQLSGFEDRAHHQTGRFSVVRTYTLIEAALAKFFFIKPQQMPDFVKHRDVDFFNQFLAGL